MAELIFNTTLEFSHLEDPAVRQTARALKRWLLRWTLTGGRCGVNGRVKRRMYIRAHKMWEYARGLALTAASAPTRPRGGPPLAVLDVGGAMTAPIFYLAGLGDRVVCLDVDPDLCAETNSAARARTLTLEARTTNLVDAECSAADLGAPGGFDRIYSFSVIEHIPPAGQPGLVRRLGGLLKPGGQMCLTFDFGEGAPSEAPIRTLAQVQALSAWAGIPLLGNATFHDTGRRYPLNRRHPLSHYTFASLFFTRPPDALKLGASIAAVQ